jgi:hypothetical protein
VRLGDPVARRDEFVGRAEAKTRFILIDAVGVTESHKSIAPPLDRTLPLKV